MNMNNSADELLRDIAKHEALISLSTDARFILLIEEGYLKDELLQASSGFTSSNREVVEAAHNKVLGCTLFREWLDTVSNVGEDSRNQLGENT